jgi:hypothetical protein
LSPPEQHRPRVAYTFSDEGMLRPGVDVSETALIAAVADATCRARARSAGPRRVGGEEGRAHQRAAQGLGLPARRRLISEGVEPNSRAARSFASASMNL